MKVKEFATVVSGATPSSEHPEYYSGDIVWFTPKDLSDQRSKYVCKGERNITQAGFDSCSAKILPAGSVLMSSRAPIGLLAITQVECCTNQGFKSFVVNEEICNAEYLYYYLKYHIREVEALGSGTTFKEVSKEAIEEYDVKLPDLEIQKKIANVLSEVDNKIANNNAICAELEAMAKLLYDYWFVQFDFPDENGKPYKSSGGKMVWSKELNGEIPEGWTIVPLKEKCRCLLGGTPNRDKKEYWNGTINWINSGKVNDFRINGPSEKITDAGLANSSTYLLPANTVVLAITGATLGQVSILNIESCANQSVIGIIETKEVPTEYIYPWIINSLKLLLNKQTGAAQPHVNKNDVQSLPLPLPNEQIMTAYMTYARDAYKTILVLEQETQELASLRDFLLPMLMNGQVGFKEADCH